MQGNFRNEETLTSRINVWQINCNAIWETCGTKLISVCINRKLWRKHFWSLLKLDQLYPWLTRIARQQPCLNAMPAKKTGIKTCAIEYTSGKCHKKHKRIKQSMIQCTCKQRWDSSQSRTSATFFLCTARSLRKLKSKDTSLVSIKQTE